MAEHSVNRIAHRGAPREHPENTLPGFARALELGADGIELDVHATRDGVVVVHHDPVPRAAAATRTLAGRPIAALTYDELRRFSIGDGIAIPTLSEVLALIGSSAVAYVEIKARNIEREVVDVIGESSVQCAVHSFDHASVRRVAVLAPSLRRGLLFSRRPSRPAAALQAVGALDAWPEWPLVDEAFVADVHRIGGSVIAWTVNDVAAARRLVSIGVDGICTDDLGLLPRGRSAGDGSELRS